MSEQPTDQELVARCLRNDQAAWEAVLARYRRKVFGIAYKYTGRVDEADDLTQDIFLKVYRALDTYDPSQELAGWLAGIARNACVDHYRRTKRERMVLSGETPDFQKFRCEGLSPQGNLELAERARMVRQCVGQLPDDLRVVLILRDLKGLSYQEIVQQLSLADGTVKSRIFRARAELAARLKTAMGSSHPAKECAH